MSRKVIFFIVFLVILSIQTAVASNPPVRLFSRADGLPHNRILCIFQDSDGLIWVGTEDGAGRYDGHHWQSYTVKDGLAGPQVYTIAQDIEGDIWFGTSGGICRYNGISWGRMGRFAGMAGQDPIVALKDGEGRLWFGGSNMIYTLDPDTNEIIPIEKVFLHGISSMFLDSENRLWITFADGIASYNGFRWKELLEKDGLPPYPIRKGFQDDSGSFWFATSGGLVEYNGFTSETMTIKSSGLPSNEIYSIDQDNDGFLWVGTSEGPAFFDGYQWMQPAGFENLPDKKVNTLMADNGGNLWLGTDAGVVFLDLSWEIITDETYVKTPRHPFLKSSEKVLWYAIEDGVESLSGRIVEHLGKRDGLEGNVRAIYEDKERDIWFGTDEGLYRYDGIQISAYKAPEFRNRTVQVGSSRWVRESYREFDIHQGLTSDNVNAIFQDANDLIWVATDKGLSALEDDRWILFEEISGLQAEVLALAGDQSLWAGSSKGLMIFDGQTWRDASLEGGPRDIRVNTIFQEGEDHFWVGTDAGLWELRNGIWKVYHQEDGLLSDQITSLAKDALGRLWIGTKAGLSFFDGVNWSSITQKEGLPAQQVLSIAADASGSVIVAGQDYLAEFHPDLSPPQTYIKNPPSAPVGSPQLLFEFYGADLLSEPFDLQYSNRLDGGEWSPFSREPLVTISDMANGMHTFEVRSIDRGLNIDPTPAVAMFEVNTALFDIEVRELIVKELYASLYQYYASPFDQEESPVGHLNLYNKYDRPLKVKVSLTIPKFMDFSTDRVIMIQPGEEAFLPLRLEFNENILSQRDNTIEQLLFELQYYIQGELKENKFSRGVTIYGRNAMFWDDPWKISLFISHLDPEIDFLSKQILAEGKKFEEEFILDNNFIRAVALFDFLGHNGVRYLPDPDHPYTGLSSESKEKKILDYIRYPRETLALKSGDCDDISTLYAAFLQSVGIDTALVDVLDHVFVMFDTGLRGSEYKLITDDRDRVFFDEANRVWVPVETTLVGQPFMKAWESGIEGISVHPENIIFVNEAWKKYQPVLGAMDVPLPEQKEKSSVFLEVVLRDLYLAEDSLLGVTFSELRTQSEREPENCLLLNQMGVILGKKGYLTKAARLFNRVILIKPEYSGGYSNIANIFYERGEYNKAIKHYMRSLELNPESVQVHIEIALTYAEMGDFKKARDHYLKAIDLNPELLNSRAP